MKDNLKGHLICNLIMQFLHHQKTHSYIAFWTNIRCTVYRRLFSTYLVSSTIFLRFFGYIPLSCNHTHLHIIYIVHLERTFSLFVGILMKSYITCNYNVVASCSPDVLYTVHCTLYTVQ